MKKFHLIRDHHDARDAYAHKFDGAFKLLPPSEVHSKSDLTPFCSPVENQASLGSCTGNALAGGVEYLMNKHGHHTQDGKFVDVSRLFIYFNERVQEGTVNEDAGAQIATGIKTLAKIGVCTEKIWPYAVNRFAKKPTPAAYAEAAARKITAYARVDRSKGIEGIRQVLASGYPIVFGFTVFEDFSSEEVAESGILNMPNKGDKDQGGHAVLMVGHDDATERVLVRNSWGKGWGQGGYFTMPYAYVASRKLAADFWTMSK